MALAPAPSPPGSPGTSGTLGWRRALRRGIKRAKRRLVALGARGLARALCLLPVAAAVRVGAFAGRVAFHLARSDRRRAIAQLQEALGLEAPEAAQVAKRVFQNTGRGAAELAVSPRIDLARYVELPGDAVALLQGALRDGRGAIFVSAHLGAFELLAQRVARAGFDAATLAKPTSNPFLAEWLVERRRRGGVETVNRGDPSGARRMLSALRRGALLGVLVDQDTRVDSVFVPFFGRLAKTPIAPAELALRLRVPVLAGFIRRRPGGGHTIRVERLELDDLAGARRPSAEAITEATARITRVIERAIRDSPDEWVWFHARWRTSPGAPRDRERV